MPDERSGNEERPEVFRSRERDAVVSVDEIPTSGYRWAATSVPRGLSLEETKFRSSSSEPVAGGGGRREFRFRAERAGSYDVELELKREWEDHAIEKKRVKVVIEDSDA